MVMTLRVGDQNKVENNPSFLGISKQIIRQAVGNGDLSLVASRKTKTSINEYYRFNRDGANLLLIHIGENQYVIASEKISYKDKEIDIAHELMKFTWSPQNVGANRDFAMGGNKDNIDIGTKTPYMHRILMMLEMYGGYGQLDKYWDVHHKGACFDHRAGCMMYIPRKDHNDSHSHMVGGKVKDYESLIGYLNTYLEMYDDLCEKTIVE